MLTTPSCIRKAATALLGVALASQAMSAATPAPKHTPSVPGFAWGVEAGGGVDMTSNDMSTINIDAFFGYRNSWIDVLGIGAEIDMMVDDSNRTFPVYAIFRTNFHTYHTPCFLDMRLGAAFNNLGERNQTGVYVAPGIGFNLAKGTTFQSYITLSYEFNGMRSFEADGYRHIIHGMHMALVRFGITF